VNWQDIYHYDLVTVAVATTIYIVVFVAGKVR
jgi:hypothetical protein